MTMSTGSLPKPSRAARARAGIMHYLWTLPVLLIGGVLIVYVLPRALYGPEVPVVPVIRGDLVQTVVASGHVETPFRVDIGSQVTGTVADVLVQEGETVHQGQTLIVLEASEAKGALVQAQAVFAQAKAKLRQLNELTLPSAQEGLKQAKANLANAQATFERVSSLLKNGFQTKAALDDAQKALDIAQTQVRTAELQVYTNSPGGSDFVLAETQLAQAQASLDSAQARLAYLSMTAPRDGVLITRNVEKGSVVQPGKALMVLAPSGDLQLIMQIDEKNIALIKLGQSALVSADAYPDRTFPASVTYINPSVDITRASVEVKLTASQPPEFIRQDMTVSVDIEVASRKDTLVLPTRAVHDLTSEPWVLKLEDGHARRVPVKTGLRAAGKVEVLGGLSAGDRLVPVTENVQAGARMRAKP